jgi:hypothetical protein
MQHSQPAQPATIVRDTGTIITGIGVGDRVRSGNHIGVVVGRHAGGSLLFREADSHHERWVPARDLVLLDQ